LSSRSPDYYNEISKDAHNGRNSSPRQGNSPSPEDHPETTMTDEEAWADFKNYLETQTEAIVQSIQSLLAAMRNGAKGSDLEEHLVEIVTIVSSVVAISNENLPRHLRDMGDDLLNELATNCDKLSDLQGTTGGATFSKQIKQAVAAASFAIARSLKQLNLLLTDQSDDENELR